MKTPLTLAVLLAGAVSMVLSAQEPAGRIPSSSDEPLGRQAYRMVLERRGTTDTATTIELAKAFLEDSAYVDSAYLFDVYKILIDAYAQARNWTMTFEAIDRLDSSFPGVSEERKLPLFNKGRMIAEYDAQDPVRKEQYAERVRAIEAKIQEANEDSAAKAGVVTGRIVLDDGSPVFGVKVEVTGGPKDSRLETTTTDRNGFYRLTGVAPGRHHVMAGNSGAETFYPGADSDHAAWVDVATAQTAAGIDFHWPVVRVRGRVILPEKQIFNDITVSISAGGRTERAAVGNNGSFEFLALLPGEYIARTNLLSEVSFITIGNKDIDGIEIKLLPMNTEEITLAGMLNDVRVAIQRYRAEKGGAPQTLEDLVDAAYITRVPRDPMTNSENTWQIEISRGIGGQGIVEIHSGSIAKSPVSGKNYNAW